MIRIKRVYEPAAKGDGRRVLVERLWPRGFRKEDLVMDLWVKEAAPSTALRKWFSHDPQKWTEFQERYRKELDANPQAWQAILEIAGKGDLTLLYSSHDEEHNNAVVLAVYLRAKKT